MIKCENCGHEIRDDTRHEPRELRQRNKGQVIRGCWVHRGKERTGFTTEFVRGNLDSEKKEVET